METLDSQEQLGLIIARIEDICIKEQIHEFVFVSTDMDESMHALTEQLAAKVSSSGIKAITVPKTMDSLEVYEQIRSVKSVLFIERIRKSKLSEVKRQIEICKENEWNVLGALLCSEHL